MAGFLNQRISSVLSVGIALALALLLAWFTIATALRLRESAERQLQAEAEQRTQVIGQYVEAKRMVRQGLTKE
jgi:hypothetical protein